MSILKIPRRDKKQSALFRTYSYHELNQLKRIEEILKFRNKEVEKLTVEKIPLKLLTVNIKGQTFFTLVQHWKFALDLVQKKLMN